MGRMASVKPNEEDEKEERRTTEVYRGKGLDKTIEGVAEIDPWDFWM
jgi:hypothetical protein